MLRVVLAVLLGAAIVAASISAIDDARVTHSDVVVEGDARRLAAAIERLDEETEPVPAGNPGARWVVTITLPSRTWGDSGVEFVRIDGGQNAIEWRTRGGTARQIRIDERIETLRPVVLRRPGDHRLTLRLVERGGRSIVLVERFEFKSDEETRRIHGVVDPISVGPIGV